MSKNPKNWGKLIKIANIDREFLHIFWTTWGNSMKFSGKMCFEIILKVTKNQSFTLSLEDTFFEKPPGGGGWCQFDSLPRSIMVKKETLAQVLSCEFWEILKKIFFIEHLDHFSHVHNAKIVKLLDQQILQKITHSRDLLASYTTSWTRNLKWKYIKGSEDVHDVF